LPAACATELIHCFSLVHDDLPCMDDDDLRRGKPACHVKFGEATALLAGDALLALAFQCALEGGMAVPRTDSPGATLRVLGALTRAVGVQGMVGGQVGDMLLQGERPTLKRVNWIHSRKTGALISAAAEVGAISGGADDERAAAAARFGAEVGLAFQIRDDLLNELSPTAQTGKSGGSDRERGKVTYPAAVGVEEAERLMLEAVERASLLARSFADDGLLEDIARSAAQRSA
ncbi:MAG: polyprenyl synthetase family protein, partial [Armatimonadota bacterium]